MIAVAAYAAGQAAGLAILVTAAIGVVRQRRPLAAHDVGLAERCLPDRP